ncbi:hypothetical protein Nepgr_031596 [Nepenthes gracilis]|uniref:Uncharacterized protein n=1 Tax=Nepenthes gracilis TaxID=150966 RepID=A0AAD3TIS9_NEPGR|nr:hypothetical protein Nepgr_031596 [Nepenthes gracilis]
MPTTKRVPLVKNTTNERSPAPYQAKPDISRRPDISERLGLSGRRRRRRQQNKTGLKLGFLIFLASLVPPSAALLLKF